MNNGTLIFDPHLANLRKAMKGDAKAAANLVRAISPRLYRVAYRILNNAAEAEDATQETLLKLWQMAPNWQPGRALIETWAYRVITNGCFDRLKKKSRLEVDDLSEELSDGAPSAEISLINRDLHNQVDRAVAELPARQRAAVILFYFEGMGQKQIAETLDSSVEAIESLLARAKVSLKNRLQMPQTESGEAINMLGQGIGQTI